LQLTKAPDPLPAATIQPRAFAGEGGRDAVNHNSFAPRGLESMPLLQTQEFASLYARVTADLKRHLDSEQQSGRLSPADRVWFDSLIVGFDAEFQRWPTYTTGPVFEYLDLFESRRASPHLRLAAHAFLHIAYDLPRVISATLQLQPAYTRESMRIAFLRPGPVLLKVFLAHARDGQLGLFARLLGRLEPARAIAFWVLALRSIAWVQAEVVADRGGCAQCERNMAVLLLKAGREAIAHRWVLGVSELDNSRLFQLVPAAGGGGFAGGVVGALIGSALTIAVVLWLMGQRAERNHAAGQIAVLGALVYSAMLRSSDPGFQADETTLRSAAR
jgi:hypothetical protein